jgi:hypothetical protein
MKMEVLISSETLARSQNATRNNNPEDHHLYSHRRENLKHYFITQRVLEFVHTMQGFCSYTSVTHKDHSCLTLKQFIPLQTVHMYCSAKTEMSLSLWSVLMCSIEYRSANCLSCAVCPAGWRTSNSLETYFECTGLKSRRTMG